MCDVFYFLSKFLVGSTPYKAVSLAVSLFQTLSHNKNRGVTFSTFPDVMLILKRGLTEVRTIYNLHAALTLN